MKGANGAPSSSFAPAALVCVCVCCVEQFMHIIWVALLSFFSVSLSSFRFVLVIYVKVSLSLGWKR
jgi:hypothetical protein